MDPQPSKNSAPATVELATRTPARTGPRLRTVDTTPTGDSSPWSCHPKDVIPIESLTSLLASVRACTICADELPSGPRPIVQADEAAPILIVGQAPGRKVHESGIPFDDASGDRLRQWMGIERSTFYDPRCVAILPMGFCFPGTGPSGDLPPRPECAPTWREKLLARLTNVQLTLVIGHYAQQYHLSPPGRSVTDAVAAWRDEWPTSVALPHPSPRNNIWLARNPWFEAELVPALQRRVAVVLGGPASADDDHLAPTVHPA